MKDKLDAESRAAIVDYRLERAEATLTEADYNTEGGYYNAAVNRLSLHFVRTGLLSIEHGTTFSLLFEKRQASDYSDFTYCDLATVQMLRPRAAAFVEDVKRLIKKA